MKKSQVTKRFAAVLACFTLLFASCGKKAPETPVAAVSLDKSSLTLVLGGAFKLTAEKENTDDDIVWACSNDKVATVGNGTVTAVGVGSAVVSASAGGASAQCAVSVTTGEQVPLIKLDYDFLEIIIGNPITVSAAVFIDGFPDNNFDGFNWSSGNAEFFTVTPISGDKSKASVAAVDLGMSYLSVAADYFGREISAEIDVTVKEDISFNIKNIAPTALGYHVTLSTAAPDNEFTPDIEVWENGEIAAGAALDWSLKAGESDTVLDSTALAAGVFTAAAVGSTIAVFSCESRLSGEIFSGEISVTVSKPVIPLSQAFDFELNANRPATILTGAAGAVQSVELDGTAIVAYTANTNESVPALKFAFTAGAGTFGLGGVTGLEYGEHDLTVETDAAIYEAKAFMVTMVIRNKTDYATMAGLTTTTNTSGTHPAGTGQSLYAAPVTNFTTSVAYNADSRTNVWGGYFVLGADIDFDDASADGRMYFGDWCGAWRYSGGGTPNTNLGFRGVFDGRGKTIYNFTAWDGAVFGTLGNGGVIRNVSFVNAAMQDIRPSGIRSGHTAFLVQHCAGRIENVTVIGKVDTTYDGTFGGNPWPTNGTYSLSMGMMWAGMLTDALFAAGRIENCVVILQNGSVINKAIPEKGTTVTASSGQVGPILSQGTRVFATRGENDYAGPQGVIRNSFAFGINPYDETPDGTNVGYYSTTEAITLANPDFATFDGGYWDLSGLLPVPKGLISWMADNYPGLMPT